MTVKYTVLSKRTQCRLCESSKVDLVVPMTPTPVGGAFVTADDLVTPQDIFPLDLYQCSDCGHVQLTDIVAPEILFSNYSYFSGKTGLVKHFSEYATLVINENNLFPNSLIVDIGSNDGAFLRCFKNESMRVLGIDPAQNIADYANKAGIETISMMFDHPAGGMIRTRYGPADIVTANNVYAHSDDLIGMTTGIRSLLKDSGLFYFEVSYLVDVVEKMLLGTIFHEHLSYHTVKPLVSFFRRHGLHLVNIRRVPIQGGSLIGTVQLAGGPLQESPSVQELVDLEDGLGIYQGSYLKSFKSRLEAVKSNVTPLITQLADSGKSIAAFGAARGGTSIIYNFDIGPYIDYIVDDDSSKQYQFSPGYHIPVLPTSQLYERKPDYVVILAWIHTKSIVESLRPYLEAGGRLITFFPSVQVIDRTSDSG